ncbi:tetratricopeptide repeat protein, partial [Candidatus Latescibacterota bacterium]
LILDGWNEYNSNRFEEAQSLFMQAIELDPNQAEGYIGDGWSLFMRQKPDSALVVFFKGFTYSKTAVDSLDIICGVSGCYLAKRSMRSVR